MKRDRTFVCFAALLCTGTAALELTAQGPPPGVTGDGSVFEEQVPSVPSSPQAGLFTDAIATSAPVNRNADAASRPGSNTNVVIAATRKRGMMASNAGGPAPRVTPRAGQAPGATRDRTLLFDAGPGTGPPPDTLGPYLMAPFPPDPRPPIQDVTSVASPCPTGGEVAFSIPLSHRVIGDGWGSWSHDYTGDVYYTNGEASVTLTMLPDTCAFYLYVEPNNFSEYLIECVANEGLADEVSSGQIPVVGDAGATYFGFFGEDLQTITVHAPPEAQGFAIGEFGIECFCAIPPGSCCDPYTGICWDDVGAIDCLPPLEWDWALLCEELDPPCGEEIGACCVGPMGEPPYDPYECIGDMTASDCLSVGEETWWNPDESCGGSPPYECEAPIYCEGSGGCDEHISLVQMGDIDNPSSCTQYGDYTGQWTIAVQALSYDLYVENGNPIWSSDTCSVWIDWNQDKVFEDDPGSDECYGDIGGVGPYNFTIDVPPTALPGFTRMRVRIDYNNPDPDPCGSTSYGEVEDYSLLVSGEIPSGSCCDPYTGVCNDDVLATECLPPLEFGDEQTCASLTPPCGNPGACCDDYSEDCVDDVLELNCTGTRFDSGGTCADFSPGCGDLDFMFVFDPDTGPPPATQCGCPMTVHPLDPRPTLMDVMDVPSPCPTGGEITFSTPLSHRRIGDGWATWSHGYTGDVYYTNGATEVTLTLPPASCGFYMYVEPNAYSTQSFKLTANGVIESEEFLADGAAAAVYAGVCGGGLETIKIESTSGADFAIGEFGTCCFCCICFGSCCDPYTGICEDDVDVLDCPPPLQWTYETDCDDLDPPCGNPGACCLPDGTCQDVADAAACDAVGGVFEGHGTDCATTDCPVLGACCEPDRTCTEVPELACAHLWRGAGTTCVPNECPCPDFVSIVSATPTDGTVDARQPHAVDSIIPRQGIGDATNPITIDLGATQMAECFALCETAQYPEGANALDHVLDNADGTYTVTLTRAITAGAVTTVQYTGDGSYVEYFSHPGNADASSWANANDIVALVDFVNGMATPPHGIYSTDINHSGMLTGADITLLVDLLNGADQFDKWFNTQLPVNTGVCP